MGVCQDLLCREAHSSDLVNVCVVGIQWLTGRSLERKCDECQDCTEVAELSVALSSGSALEQDLSVATTEALTLSHQANTLFLLHIFSISTQRDFIIMFCHGPAGPHI